MSVKTEDKSERINSINTDKPKSKNKFSKKIVITISSIVLVFIVGILAVSAYVSNYDTAFPNVYVADIPVEGLTENEILEKLDAKYLADKISGFSIPLVCNDSRDEISIDELNVKFLNNETAARAFDHGKHSNLIGRAVSFISHLLNKTVIDPVIYYDAEVFNNKVNSVTAPYEQEPVGYTFSIEPDKITVHNKVKGVKADRGLITSTIEAQICNMKFEAITITPVDMEPEPFNLDDVYKWLTADAVDAYYEKGEDGKIMVVPEKLKCNVDKSAIDSAVTRAGNSPEGFVTIEAKTEKPEHTKAELESKLYCDLLGSYKTGLGGSAARVNNVILATSRINGTELMPEEEFSYDKAILPRSSANGYQAAPVYVGNKVESGMGGGICQPSSTLYSAALYANLGIVERHNHSMAVGYIPAGMDATIAEGALDLRIKNTTGYPVKIVSEVSGGTVNFSIYGYNPDKYSVEVVRGTSGGAYLVTRVIKKDGIEVNREQMPSSRYVPHEEDDDDKKNQEEKKEEEKKPDAPPIPSDESTSAEPTPAPAPETTPASEVAPAPTPEPAPVPAPEPVQTTPAASSEL